MSDEKDKEIGLTFEVDFCPECRKPAIAIVEILEIKTPIKRKRNGEFIYEADDIRFRLEEPEPKINLEGNVQLGCVNSHNWYTKQLAKIGPANW